MSVRLSRRPRSRTALGAALALVLVGGGALLPVSQARAAQTAPVQMLALTDTSGTPTEVATAGLDPQPSSSAGGNAVAPGLSARLAALVATETPDVADPAQDAAVLTDPLEVDEFLVAGFRWDGASTLPEGTEIQMRVRENGAWSDWYVSEVDGSGRDDGAGGVGTSPFLSGGADAVQVRVTGDAAGLPAGLELALVPENPSGEEDLDPSALETTQAEPTPVAEDGADTAATPEGGDPSTAVPSAVDGSTPGAEPTATAEPTGSASGTSGGGSGVNPALVLPATTTTNGLPVPVTTRAEWGASSAYLDWNPTYVKADHAIIHHTVGTNSYSMSQSASIVRGIYYYHAVTLDWGDIGYNFLVDKYGQVFEGRYGTVSAPSGQMVVAAHARGANTGSMGIALMGTFSSTAPTSAQLTNAGKLAGWLLSRAGITNASGSGSFTIRTTNGKYNAGDVISLAYVSGHRDVYPTECPGNAAYAQLSAIRAAASTAAMSDPAGNNSFLLTNSMATGAAEVTFTVTGPSGAQPLSGKWASGGRDGVGLVLDARYSLYPTLRYTSAITFQYGDPGDTTVVGDWDGDGKDTLAVRRGNIYYVRNSLTTGRADTQITYGNPGDQVLVGDWDGDGKDTFGVWRLAR